MTEFRIKNITIPHRLILAPMCGITLLPFRLICIENGAQLVFNQMVSATAITMRDRKSFQILSFDRSKEKFIGLQLFGKDAKTLAEAAKILQELSPDIIDLNLGCPARNVVNGGGGAALMKDESALHSIFKEMRKSIQAAFTIKMRAGWDENKKNALNVAKIAESEGIDAIFIHARTRSQGYSGKPDWNIIREVKESVQIPVIGNGDIKSASEAYQMMDRTGCDAVMIGRGAFETPWIFNDFLSKKDSIPSNQVIKDMILRQYSYSMRFFGPETGIRTMRKFICAYSKGRKNGNVFRNDLVRVNDWNEIQTRIESFFCPNGKTDNSG